MSPKKRSTEELIEELALSIAKGFAATATKEEVASIKEEVASAAMEMRKGLQRVEHRLDRIEFNTAGLANRLDAVEDRVVQLARQIGIQFN